jgi:hypothetical protein
MRAPRTSAALHVRSAVAKIDAIGNFYEGMGVLVKTGLVDQELVLQMFPIK